MRGERVEVGIRKAWSRLRRDQRGLTAVEYGVFAAFVVLLLVGAAIVIGPKLQKFMVDTVNCITTTNKATCNYGDAAQG